MSIAHKINLFFHNMYNRKFEKKTHRALRSDLNDVFKKSGEGLYYCCIKASKSNFISRVIGKLSGGFSHCVLILYSDKLQRWFDPQEWLRINIKWSKYYKDNSCINNDIKALVLASADDNGMNFFDFSVYHNREITIRKIPIDSFQIKRILHWIVSTEVIKSCYDYVGLVFFLISKKVDAPEDFYCSELIHDALERIGLKITNNSKPSPTELNSVKKEWLIYSSVK